MPEPDRVAELEMAIAAVSGASKARAAAAAHAMRWMLATIVACGLLIATAIFWQSYQGRVTLVVVQRHGCMRTTLDRVAEARHDAQDTLREWMLSTQPAPAAVRLEHARSSYVDRRTVVSLMSRTGLRAPARMAAVTAILPGSLRVVAARRAFCSRVFPSASPWPWDQ